MVYSNCQSSSAFFLSLTYSSIYLRWLCGHLLGKSCPLGIHLCCFYFSAVLIEGVPFPFGVHGRMSNSIVSVPHHCLCIYLYRFLIIAFVSACIGSSSLPLYLLVSVPHHCLCIYLYRFLIIAFVSTLPISCRS